ncbi:MAG: LysR family transcriptional regulator [Roseburia sp.]
MEKLQLEYFLSVAETLNISKSAEKLFISQSSLSQTIRRLEKEIGYPLFDRNGKHICLNENGQVFLECVNRMKEIFENALEEIAEQNNIKNNQVTINMQCASHFLPQLMLYLSQKMPDTIFQISQQNYAAAKSDDADLRIAATPEPLNTDYASLLLKENILLAVPQNHVLFQKPTITISDLVRENFISLNPAWSLEQLIRTECQKKNFSPKVMIQVDNPDILRRLLVEKLGLAFVPEVTWGTSFSNGEFVLRSVSDFSVKRYVSVVWNEGFIRENVKECISHIRNFFGVLTGTPT